MTVRIYTDGACSGNPGPGGWGAMLLHGDTTHELSGAEPDTTNNRMELMAAIQGLEALKRACEVTIITDSKYVMQGMEQWIHGWRKNGWKTAAKQPVKNADLWQRLSAAAERHTLTWEWVRGHTGDVGNERVDALARAAIVAMRRG